MTFDLMKAFQKPQTGRKVRKRPERTKLEWSERFRRIDEASGEMGENNDCSVKAAAILLDVPYEYAHEVFKSAGRQNRKPTHGTVTYEAYKFFGFNLISLAYYEMDRLYPKGGKSITTYHPIRYPDLWSKWRMTPLLIHTRGHAVAWKLGRMHCWAGNRSLRIQSIRRLVEIE